MSSSSTWGYRTKDLVLGALAGKVTQPSDIAQTEKALLSVNEGSLYFPIFSQNTEVGGVFIGFVMALLFFIDVSNAIPLYNENWYYIGASATFISLGTSLVFAAFQVVFGRIRVTRLLSAAWFCIYVS